MKHNSPKNMQPLSSSSDRTTSETKPSNMLEASIEETSSNEMEEILNSARQTVKPIIKREAENEIVSEEILSFKMVRF